jgi:hypothetical protein
LILVVATACGGAFLITDVGQQALVDERVRVTETFGGSVDNAEYAALQAHPPWWTYVTSGSRLLLTPPVTLLVALALWAVARNKRPGVGFAQALAIAVHASVVLVIGQLVATPVNYVRESLTSPLNLAAILPLVEDGTVAARIFGTVDVFALWWMALLAIGLAALTGHRARSYGVWFLTVYLGFAAVMAGVIVAAGGS